MKFHLFKTVLILFIFTTNVIAAELLPFPDDNRSSRPSREQSALMKFTKNIKRLDCKNLKEVQVGLSKRLKKSKTSSDRRYYRKRIDVVEDTRFNKKCK